MLLVIVACITAITIILVSRLFDVIEGVSVGTLTTGEPGIAIIDATLLIALSSLITLGITGLVQFGNNVTVEPEPNPIIEYEKIRHRD